jgi:hypothetical protein
MIPQCSGATLKKDKQGPYFRRCPWNATHMHGPWPVCVEHKYWNDTPIKGV